ncbi:MAG: hypothetical protein JWL64_2223 [Frankiales bacterium]|nr:hypothetical protein [Frankiales bacterium]
MRSPLLALALAAGLLLTACGGDGPPAASQLPPVPLGTPVPVGPADLSAPADTSRLTGAYAGEACGPLTPAQVMALLGLPARVEFAVRAGTVIGTDPPASQTSCLYAALSSSVGLSVPSAARPADVATYAAQVRDALGECADRATRELTVVGLPATLVSCPSQSSRVLALQGREFAPGVASAATCAVLNAASVDENRFLGFCADTLRRAAAA